MQVRIARWGSDLAVPLPEELALRLGLVEGSRVELSAEPSRIVISVDHPVYALDELLTGMRPGELPEAFDWGMKSSIDGSGCGGQALRREIAPSVVGLRDSRSVPCAGPSFSENLRLTRSLQPPLPERAVPSSPRVSGPEPFLAGPLAYRRRS